MDFSSSISTSISAHIDIAERVKAQLIPDISLAGQKILEAFKENKKLFLIGNGGSAADAQHIAAEFTGRFLKERIPLPAIALTTDTSALTAIGNDYGFEHLFSRQLAALANKGDLLLAISTSGNSPNVIKAVELARERGLFIIGMSGNTGGKLKHLCDINLMVDHEITARVQEMHIMIGHLLCECVDSGFNSL